MQAGRLREIITLLSLEVVQSSTGTVKEVFTPLATVRAEVISQNSRKAMMRGEELYPMTRVFRFRTPPIVKGGDRILYRGVQYSCLPPDVSSYEGVQTVTAEQVNE